MSSHLEPTLFLDTSVQIARHVHGPKTKAAIKQRLAQHSRHTTSLVVRQEFKRRLLKEADYLLRLLHRYNSFGEVQQHVIRLFGPWHARKRSICLQALAQVHGSNDAELTERLQLYLRSLLVSGLRRFDQMVDEVRGDSKCACARFEIVEKQPLRRYEFGTDKCSRTVRGSCGIADFLAQQSETITKILAHFRSLSGDNKSMEIESAERFLLQILAGDKPQICDPCLTVGDLVIALESAGSSHFLTFNGVESQHYCRVLDQTLIVHPVDPMKPEHVCPAESMQWPKFGNAMGTE